MDLNHREPHEDGQGVSRPGKHRDPGAGPSRPRGSREPLTEDPYDRPPAWARTVQIFSGDCLLTVNPVDGSEIMTCPPAQRPGPPPRRSAGERATLHRTVRELVPDGAAGGELPLLERDEERKRLVRLVSQGWSVRVTGPGGSGRSALLDALAADCAGLAPDGVVRLSGYHRTPADLLYELFATVYRSPLHRPGRSELLELVGGIGAVVVLDDLEFGGRALDELLDATPECVFVMAATSQTPMPSADADLEEITLTRLSRDACLELLECAAQRPLTADETAWATDLWFAAGGLPLRFVQAAALLRQQGASPDRRQAAALPALAEAAVPAALLASRLSGSARDLLGFAAALGGECPHQAQLPAFTGDAHADAALGELLGCGLVTPAGGHYRLAAGVLAQLTAAGHAEYAAVRAHAVAQYYTWWAGRVSSTPQRVAAEADVILAALAALAANREAGHLSAAVLLARTVAPALAAGLHWSAWERTLRCGQKAARQTGDMAEEAYFRHELGVLSLCEGDLDRARAELEASLALRGVLADQRGTVAGRRALALVADRSEGFAPGLQSIEEQSWPPSGAPAALPPTAGRNEDTTEITLPLALLAPSSGRRGGDGTSREAGGLLLRGSRRNLAATGAGAVLAAVLGAVVTLGLGPGGDEDSPTGKVKPQRSAEEDPGSEGSVPGAPPAQDPAGRPYPGGNDTPEASPGGGPATSGGTPGTPEESGEPEDRGEPTPEKSPEQGEPSPPLRMTFGPPTPPGPTTSPPASKTEPSGPPMTPGGGAPGPGSEPVATST